jgi:hypothetical protein
MTKIKISNTISRDNGGAGLRLPHGSEAELDGTLFERNSEGGVVVGEAPETPPKKKWVDTFGGRVLVAVTGGAILKLFPT